MNMFYVNYETVSNTMLWIYAINFVVSIAIIFFDKKSPTATLAWIMVLDLIPVVGLVFYLVFSQHISRLKVSRASEREHRFQSYLLDVQKNHIIHGFVHYSNDVTERWKSMIMLNLENANSLLLGNKSIELLPDGKEMFDRLIRDIQEAKESVDVCYFIIKDDEVGQRLIECLTEKAREGLRVRLLMDAMGSKQINSFKLREFKEAGGRFAFYFKPKIRHLFLRFNYRNHRKIVVIDSNIGYIGGFNIAREYLGLKKKFGYWRDTHIRIVGASAIDLLSRFVLDWRYSSGEEFEITDVIKQESVMKNLSGSIPAQIVSSGPDESKEQIKRALMRMITSAEESIYIQTPYFVPDDAIIESLEMAAQSGVDVRIMIPCMPDHPFVYHTTLYNAGILLESGVKIYIYNNGFLHAKTMVVDKEVSTVGSANFDIRSFRLNFETNAFIYDRNFGEQMEKQFKTDIEKSHLYTLEDRANRGIYKKMMERISRLLSEIL